MTRRKVTHRKDKLLRSGTQVIYLVLECGHEISLLGPQRAYFLRHGQRSALCPQCARDARGVRSAEQDKLQYLWGRSS